MKRFMELFEDLMVAIAFAEEGITDLNLSESDNRYKELGEKTWELHS